MAALASTGAGLTSPRSAGPDRCGHSALPLPWAPVPALCPALVPQALLPNLTAPLSPDGQGPPGRPPLPQFPHRPAGQPDLPCMPPPPRPVTVPLRTPRAAPFPARLGAAAPPPCPRPSVRPGADRALRRLATFLGLLQTRPFSPLPVLSNTRTDPSEPIFRSDFQLPRWFSSSQRLPAAPLRRLADPVASPLKEISLHQGRSFDHLSPSLLLFSLHRLNGERSRELGIKFQHPSL